MLWHHWRRVCCFATTELERYPAAADYSQALRCTGSASWGYDRATTSIAREAYSTQRIANRDEFRVLEN